MSKVTYITGHKNPDTDTICSAIAYSELKNTLGENTQPVRTGELNEETIFVLQTFTSKSPELLENVAEKKVILVDHNETKQSPEGIDKAEIIEILDHHKVSFSYGKPITILTKPYGSTASLVYEKYKEHGIELSKNMAGLLLSAILSDTVVFRSPTTTDFDKQIAQELATKAEITDIETFGIELKKQKASLAGKSAKELITTDFKEFAFQSRRAAIGQIEVVTNDEFNARRDEFIKALNEIKIELNADFIAFMVTNIMEKGTELIVVGDTEFVGTAFGKEVKYNSLYLENAMSRKKDIVPVLEQ